MARLRYYFDRTTENKAETQKRKMKTIIPLILLSLCSNSFAVCAPQRDKYGHIKRSHKVTSDFRKTVPCPATGKTGKRCKGQENIDQVIIGILPAFQRRSIF